MVVPSTSGSRSRCTPARDTSATRLTARRDLVDLVQKHNAVLLDVLNSLRLDLFVVQQLAGFFVGEHLQRFLDLHLAVRLLAAADVREHGTDLVGHFLHARRPHDVHAWLRPFNVDLHFLVVEQTFAQALAERLARAVRAVVLQLGRAETRRRPRAWQQDVQDPVLGAVDRTRTHFAHLAFTRLLDRNFDQVTHDAVHITTDVADLGELRCFDLDERRVGEFRQTPRDFRLADAGRSDHQDVLRGDFLAQRFGDLLTPPPVAQRDSYRFFRAALADDVFIEFRDDLGGSHGGHRWSLSCAREYAKAELLDRLDDAIVVRVNAHVARDCQCLFDDIARREFGVFGERLRRSLRIRTARTDRANAVFRIEHVAVTRNDERSLRVGGNQHGFQPAQHAVRAPVLRELDGGACQIALVLFQLGFEAVEERKRVGRAPR